MANLLRFQIDDEFHKKSLIKFLHATVGQFSKMHLRDLVINGRCYVDGTVQDTGYHLKNGQIVEVEIDPDARTSMNQEAIPLDIVYEDEQIIVLNKPTGMLVHPTFTQQSGTLMNGLAHYLNSDRKEGFVRAGLIHRLDRKTSGLLVIAKNPRAHRILCDHFKRKLVEKVYIALVDGIVSNDSGQIDARIARDAEKKLWWANIDGKPALTEWNVLERRAKTTLMQLHPVTGRTNQLRIHCAHIGHPIVGDDWYGGSGFERLCLHAAKLSFWHPDGNLRLSFESPMPPEFDNA